MEADLNRLTARELIDALKSAMGGHRKGEAKTYFKACKARGIRIPQETYWLYRRQFEGDQQR